MRHAWLWPVLFLACAVLAAATGWISAHHTAQRQDVIIAKLARQVTLECNANRTLNDLLVGALHRSRRSLELDLKAGKAGRARIDRASVKQLVKLIDGYELSVAFCEARTK